MPTPVVNPFGLGRRFPRGYAEAIRETPGLIAYWRLRDAFGTVARDELNGTGVTLSGSPPLAQGTPIPGGGAIKTDGSTQYGTVAINLSALSTISLSFWLWWDTFANNDKLAFEFGGTNYLNSGFMVDPNESATSKVEMVMGLAAGSISWADAFPRPSAATWHHYVLCFDRATPVNTAYLDGVPAPSFSTVTHTAGTYGNFSNSTLRLMCRNGASLFGAGRLSEVAIFNRILTVNDAASQYNAGIGR